jgi:hypothetical protein
METRKSEVIIVKDNRRQYDDVFEVRRIPVDLPWDVAEKIAGYCANNVLIDITGAVDELERFKTMLMDTKNVTDAISGECLARTRNSRSKSWLSQNPERKRSGFKVQSRSLAPLLHTVKGKDMKELQVPV